MKFLHVIIVIVIIIIIDKSRDHLLDGKKILWMFWNKGEENLTDEYNKMCIWGWRKLNPDWDIRVLNNETAKKYIPEIVDYDIYSIQTKADMLRSKLLYKYGGVWADVSTLPLKPLTGNIEKMDNDVGIFFYRYIPQMNNILISNWFIVVKNPENYLLKQLIEKFNQNLIKNRNILTNAKIAGKRASLLLYFIYHQSLSELYKTDPIIHDIIDKLTITNDQSHAPLWGKEYPELRKENIDILPLVFKRAKKIDTHTYHNYIESIL